MLFQYKTLTNNVQVPQTSMEFERELVTRFRTGSHSLAIEIGRYSNISRENRLCSCGNGVQTVWHIMAECCETRDIVNKTYNSLKEVFEDDNRCSQMLCDTIQSSMILNYTENLCKPPHICHTNLKDKS